MFWITLHEMVSIFQRVNMIIMPVEYYSSSINVCDMYNCPSYKICSAILRVFKVRESPDWNCLFDSLLLLRATKLCWCSRWFTCWLCCSLRRTMTTATSLVPHTCQVLTWAESVWTSVSAPGLSWSPAWPASTWGRGAGTALPTAGPGTEGTGNTHFKPNP